MSPFTDISPEEWVASNAHAFAIRDRFPVSPGHTLIITRRAEVRDWFEATDDERRAIFELVEHVKADLDRTDPRPDGYNVGFNAGEAAGQTVMHLHVHVIPRFRGDVDDPRGGIRHVIPSKANYLRDAERDPSPDHELDRTCIGSRNLSRSAFDTDIESSLRVDRVEDVKTHARRQKPAHRLKQWVPAVTESGQIEPATTATALSFAPGVFG